MAKGNSGRQVNTGACKDEAQLTTQGKEARHQEVGERRAGGQASEKEAHCAGLPADLVHVGRRQRLRRRRAGWQQPAEDQQVPQRRLGEDASQARE